METENKGMLIVVSAPSGAGKTTLCHMLINDIEKAVFSVSLTSRLPRNGEINGVDYYFIDEDTFIKKINENEFLEWAKVHGNYYGTSAQYAENHLIQGKYLILDIDVQGGLQIKAEFPAAVLIFVMPPSLKELKNRLINRRQDSSQEIERRLKVAYDEMKLAENYDYVVENNELETALREMKVIIAEEEKKGVLYEKRSEKDFI